MPPRRAEAKPAAGAAGQGERGEHFDERGAKRQREEDTTVEPTMPWNLVATVAARQRRGAKRAAGQAERAVSVSERRREGYPPEGPRPRSGLGRVARSRSDAPRLIVAFGTSFTIIGITTGTAVVGNGHTDAIITVSIMTGTGVEISVVIGGGADSTLLSCRA